MLGLETHLPRLILASSPYEVTEDLGLFAAVTLKSCSLEPIEGPCRFEEVAPDTFMNRWGLDNPGIASVVSSILPKVRVVQPNVILSAFFTSNDELQPFMEQVPFADLLGVELNISCPNRKGFDSVFSIIESARGVIGSKTKLGLKINNGFNLNTLKHLPLDFITYSNTLPHVHESFGLGGLSGKPLREVVVRELDSVRSKFSGTLVACGGIKTAQDYTEYINLGADYVGIASQYLKNREVVFNILSGI